MIAFLELRGCTKECIVNEESRRSLALACIDIDNNICSLSSILAIMNFMQAFGIDVRQDRMLHALFHTTPIERYP